MAAWTELEERAARAAFVAIQRHMRKSMGEYDRIATWEGTTEAIRENWRYAARAALLEAET